MRVEECDAELFAAAPRFYPPGTSGQTSTTSQSGRPNIRARWLKLVTAGIELRESGHIRHATSNAQHYMPLTKGVSVTAKVVSIVERRTYQSNAISLMVCPLTWV